MSIALTNALGMTMMRFGMRGGGFVMTLLSLAVIGALVWALTRPQKGDA